MTQTIASLRLHQDVLPTNARNWDWLATALEVIALEIRKGEHRDSLLLAVYEAHTDG
jgi:hypothetical protein